MILLCCFQSWDWISLLFASLLSPLLSLCLDTLVPPTYLANAFSVISCFVIKDTVFQLESLQKGSVVHLMSTHDNNYLPPFHFISNSMILTQLIKLLSQHGVQQLVNTHPPPPSSPFIQAVSSALVECCGTGDLPTAQYMISLGAHVNYHHVMHGSALYHAVNHGDVTMTQWLLQQGAHADGKSLVIACRNNQKDIARVLVEIGGVSVHENIPGIGTAVHAVVIGGSDAELLRWLVHKGADVDAEDDTKCTALQIAVEIGHKHLIHCLVLECRADVRRVMVEGGERGEGGEERTTGIGEVVITGAHNADVAEYVRLLVIIRLQQNLIEEQQEKLRKIPALEQRVAQLEQQLPSNNT